MTKRLVALLVVLLMFGAAAPVGALTGAASESVAEPDTVTQPENETTNESDEFGASVSAFVQTSAADAEGEVNDGVFTARFDNASNETRKRLVQERTDRIAGRVAELRAQRADLLNTTGTLTVAERARAARLAARIDALQMTLNVTEDAAMRAGVNESRLRTLRTEANELSGPEVAELARGMAGGPDARGDRPTDTTPNTPSSNRTDGDGDDRGNGPPTDGSDDAEDPDQGDGGGDRSDEAGQGSDGTTNDDGRDRSGGGTDDDRGSN